MTGAPQPPCRSWLARWPVGVPRLQLLPNRHWRRRVLTAAFKPGQPWGNVNRLASGGADSEAGAPGFRTDAEEESFSHFAALKRGDGAGHGHALLRLPGLRQLKGKWEDACGRLSYAYFNWREDTWSNLQLFMLFNLTLLMLGGWVEGSIIRQLDATAPRPPENGEISPLWGDLYAVMVWMLGQDLPRVDASGLASQVFAVLAVFSGLVSFALVLALIEQVVLEVLESNVKQGSRVFEEGHIVVLGWCESAYDLSQLTRILGQLCHANVGRENCVVVVLSQDRDKLDMEAIFRKAIPDSNRHGTKFVFRQGSPLDPEALRMVAAARARAIIIASDGARAAPDADAQCLRAAVLLEELIDTELASSGGSSSSSGQGPSIVLQVQDPDCISTLRYACSSRVIPVPAYRIQARRICRIVRNPVVAVMSNMFTDYRSAAHMSVHTCPPDLAGRPFHDLHFMFPEAIVLGVIVGTTNRCKINPPPDRITRPGDALILLRPGPAGSCPPARPLPQPLSVDMGNWNPAQYTLNSQDEEPLGVEVSSCSCTSSRAPRPLSGYLGVRFSGVTSQTLLEEEAEGGEHYDLPPVHAAQKRGLFVLPLQYSSSLAPTGDLLICGWSRTPLMTSLLEELDHGQQALPPGSNVTLVNDHDLPDNFVSSICSAHGVASLNIRHVKLDPRHISDLRSSLDMSSVKAAIVVADTRWANNDAAAVDHRFYSMTQSDMLRMDAAGLMVQLNIRTLLEERCLPDISIVVQRMTFVGNTKFEDPSRLPLGLPINPLSFIGKVLTRVALEPQFLRPFLELGSHSDMIVQDSSAFAAPGEELSFLQLQARALSVQQIVVGYFRIPSSGDQALEVVVNPHTIETRSEKLTWNRGDSRCKLVTLATAQAIVRAQHNGTSQGGGSSSSDNEGKWAVSSPVR